MTGRRGFTVVEALVALLLGLLAAQLALTVLVRQREVQLRLTRRSEALGALRTARHLLREELRQGAGDGDWRPLGPDAFSLRAFRGGGGICSRRAGGDEVLVAYQGIRLPDPAKDSLLILDAGGAWTAWELASVSPTALRCPGAAPAPLLRIGVSQGGPVRPVYGRVFESGSYHLSDGALRYRRGGGGRQPLTPEVLMESSGYAWAGSARLRLRSREGGPLGRGWSGFLAWGQGHVR